jgi:hypothetical protein
MKKQNLLLLIGIGLLVLAFVVGNLGFDKKEDPVEKVEELQAPSVYTGQIILLLKGNDIIMSSSTPKYGDFKKAIEEILFTIQGPAYPGSIFPEEAEEGQFSINKVKLEAIGVSTFLTQSVEIETNSDFPAEQIHSIKENNKGKTNIITDHIVIVLGGEHKGVIFTRDSFESKKWTAWQGDHERISNLVSLMQQEW